MCEICSTNHATIHITEIINNHKKEIHLCEECANKKGVIHKVQFSVQDLVSNVIEQKSGKSQSELQSLRCSNCGMTYQTLKSKVRLGCASDLEIFKDWLVPFLEKIHDGAASHVGKVPRTISGVVVKENSLLRLKRDLDKAVKDEDYEKAARIRDEIKRLESELK